jgi:LPS O-antigen subunit length determinant protein (WzzB/FepE family)
VFDIQSLPLMSNDPQKEIQQLQVQLNLVEQRLQRATLDQGMRPVADDEIDLRELWQVIWNGKLIIIGVTALFAVLSVIYALSLPNVYKSTVVLAPAESDGGGLGGLAAQYGGLAAMAGINLGGGGSSQVDEALEFAASWPFLETVISDNQLAPLVLAVKSWDKSSGQVIYDPNVYDLEKKQWMIEAAAYSSWKSYEAFKGMLQIAQDKKTGFVTISIEYVSPVLAADWVEMLVAKINAYYQDRAIADTQKNIAFLELKANETAVSEMRSVFYSLIEEQTKSLMLASLNKDYLLKTVVPAKVAEQKSEPKRTLIVVLSILLGGVAGVLYTLLRYFVRQG